MQATVVGALLMICLMTNCGVKELPAFNSFEKRSIIPDKVQMSKQDRDAHQEPRVCRKGLNHYGNLLPM
jgi:hypothetical protein